MLDAVLPSPHDARIGDRNSVPPRQPWQNVLSYVFGETCTSGAAVVGWTGRGDRWQDPRRMYGSMFGVWGVYASARGSAVM